MQRKTKAVDESKVYPRFLKKLEELVANCEARGVQYWATSGFRSWTEQDALYALGRTVKNVDATPAKPMGGTVTKAKGGQSYHNMTTACDFALDGDTTRAGLQPDWNREAYLVLAEEAKKLGLDAGFWWTGFPDAPHVQLDITKAGLNLASMQALYKKGGIPAIWAELDKHNW